MAADYPSGLTSKTLMGQTQDNISSTINQAGGINSTATTVTLASGAAFPTSGYIRIDNETMKYTGKSSNDLTGLTRGLFGTAAAAHANGVAVELTNSGGYIDELQEEVVALETKVGVDGSAVTTTLDFLAKSATARAYPSSQQTIPNITDTKVNLGTENWDIGGNFADSRFTAPAAGKYQINAAVSFVTSSVGARMAFILVNGGQTTTGSLITANGGFTRQGSTLSDILNLAANDYVDLYCHQNSGGDLALNAGSSDTFMSISLIKL